MALGIHVDPFAVEDPSELPDWRLPLSFMKSRHSERVEKDRQAQEPWRMKERVRALTGRRRVWFWWKLLRWFGLEQGTCWKWHVYVHSFSCKDSKNYIL